MQKSDNSHASWSDHDGQAPVIDIYGAPFEQMISDRVLRATCDVSAATTRAWRSDKRYDPPLEHTYLPGAGIRYRVGNVRKFFQAHEEKARTRFAKNAGENVLKAGNAAAAKAG